MEADFQIKCPNCGELCEFTYAESIRIKKKDASYFLKSKIFKIEKTTGWSESRTYYYTLHYPYIMPNLENIIDLPEKYTAENWRKRIGHGIYRTHLNDGVAVCSLCNIRQKHVLKWPEDAYFQIDYKGQTLWAYNRTYALKLRDYIASNDRKKRHPNSTEYHIFQDSFLRKIPEHFQSKKARTEIVKKIEKLIGN